MRPAIASANQAGTRSTYPGRMEDWVDLGSLIAAQPGIKPTTAWSQVRRLNRYATELLKFNFSDTLKFTSVLGTTDF